MILTGQAEREFEDKYRLHYRLLGKARRILDRAYNCGDASRAMCASATIRLLCRFLNGKAEEDPYRARIAQ